MLKISIQTKFIKEKQYVIDYILNELLGLEYSIFYCDKPEYKIEFNESTLIFKDSFFSKTDDIYYYRNIENLPKHIVFQHTEFAPELNLAVLFGNDLIKQTENHLESGNDIFAATFFMLSRWEEIASTKRDKHNRFDERYLYSIENNIAHRPIVNEYAEFLKNVLVYFGCKLTFKTHLYKLFITHDIDDFARYDSPLKFIKALGGDIIKRKSISTLAQTFSDYFSISLGKKKDVYDTFDFLMNVSEKYNNKSRFYFLPGKKGEFDVRFDIEAQKVLNIIQRIIYRKHIVGIHPSYNSYNDEQIFQQEIDRLRIITNELKEGRQHYLRFENPTTWELWEKNQLLIDSSIGFYSNIGFRAGVCTEYPVFNIINREKLRLRERPLIIMDTALRATNSDKEKILESCRSISETVKKYRGDFVILWHNSNLRVNEWKNWDKFYEELIEIIS